MNYWSDLRSRQVIPPGYLTIAEAFEIIGRHRFGPNGSWSGLEAKYERSSMNPNPTPDPLLDRRLSVFWTMQRLGMSSSIKRGLGYCFLNDTGGVKELDTSHWNCGFDVACDRFDRAALCVHPLYTMHRPSPWKGGEAYFEYFTQPIFVPEAGLQAVLDIIPADNSEQVDGQTDLAQHVISGFFARRSRRGSDTTAPEMDQLSESSDDEMRDREVQRVADFLDAKGFPKRELRASLIAGEWNRDHGAPPSVQIVYAKMKGGGRLEE